MSKSAPNYIPEVRAQYETLPYPARKPKDEKHRLLTGPLMRLDAVNHHCFNGKQDFNNFRVLIAGGGTGDSTMVWGEQLLGREGSGVTYLDMSEASRDIAQRRAQARGLDNIEWVNDSLLNLPRLGLESFDYIDCTGVLHHLEDPDAGLKALASVLKPDGAMNLMVYARYGRSGIYQVQELMRLVNGAETDTTRRVENVRAMLKSLPPHHWVNISKQLGWHYGDVNDDAEMLDMFLHAQDRPYTIGEVHDWLSRCGLRLASEPGTRYTQLHYLPETYIKDADQLARIKKFPKAVQQGIAEAVSTKIAMHEFFAVPKARGETVADLFDPEMIPWPGTGPMVPYSQLADVAAKHGADFTVTLDNVPGKPAVSIPKGRYVESLLRHIDGQRSIRQIVEAVRADPKFKESPPSDVVVLADFEKLFISLNRGHAAYLRHPSVAAFPPVKAYEDRVKALG